MILKCTFAQLCVFPRTKVKQCFGKVFLHYAIFGLKNATINILQRLNNKGYFSETFLFEP